MSRARSIRPVLGFLTAWITDGYATSAWSGVMDVARELNADVIHFVGARLRTPLASEAPASVIFDLPCPANVDGLIICSEMLYHFVDLVDLNRFVSRYRPLPMTSIGLLPDIPSVFPDIQAGVRAMMDHLVQVHGYRRLVFLRGPVGEETAEAGYRGYRQALGEHGVPFSETLVTPAAERWGKEGGAASIRVLLDERGLRPGRDFDALVGLGDNETLGAMQVLQERGYSVPTDVAVTGLNNIDISRFMTPSLTTVDRQIAEVARSATTTLLDLIAGNAVPQQVVVQPRVVVRRSCGCMPETVVEAANPAPPTKAARKKEAPRAAIAAAVRHAGRPRAVGLVPGLAPDWAERLVDAFYAELDGGAAGQFLADLESILKRVMVADEDLSAWHGVLSELRRQAQAALPGERLRRAEDLWQQARALIADFAERGQGLRKLASGEQVASLGHITQSLISTFDVASLMDTLAAELPRLNIPSGFLALYEDPDAPLRRARLILAYQPGGRIALEPGGGVYATAELVNLALRGERNARRQDLVVLPLYFRDEQQGLLILEMGPRDGSVYDGLRVQIASALKGAALVRHNAELYDAAVQARRVAEEADQLKSRFLATVSHELRTPLTLIVGTIEMLLQEPAGAGGGLPAPWRSDLECVYGSAEHLSRLISDVLDLASSQVGQLRLACQALDPAHILQQAATIAEPLVRDKGLRWRVEIPERLPYVWGDRTRLQQVVLNLVINAVKFTAQGEVSLQAASDGKTVTVSVSDSGVGIPAAEQAAIFDEFRQSERTAGRGYGGMGLGLAICHRLIEMHGGRIAARSPGLEGSGSTFYFTLPAIDQTRPDELEGAPRDQAVLILTEAADGSGLLSRHLESRGFLVEIVSIAERADWLADIIAVPPGAVVLDFEPAAERGWELMQLIKQSPSLQDMPVLFYALSDQENTGSLLELDYLTKPVASADLMRALARQGVGGGQDGERGRAILIVDDESCILDMHTRIIQARLPGCRVLKAANGRAALAVMAREVIDLVLLDLMMPELDGFAVLEAMQTHETMRGIPVIVITAQILTQADMRRLQKGVAAVLSKGLFSSAEVLSEVEAALARSKRLGTEAQRVARRVMAYLHEHYAEAITRGDLAHFVALSERHLDRCFRQETGLGPMEYLNRYRVKQARMLLETGTASVTEVALAVGFSDSSYFGRVFRSETGLTPAAYRRSH